MVGKSVKLKITVLRRFAPDEVFDKAPIGVGELGKCSVFEDDQEFIVGEGGSMPEGFCVWKKACGLVWAAMRIKMES